MSSNAETQSAIASVNMSLHNINTEVVALREQFKKTFLKRRKVCWLCELLTLGACAEGYCTWFVRPSVHLSVCLSAH